MGQPSLEMLAVDKCPCGRFWDVFQHQNLMVEKLEGSERVAESDSIIRSSHREPFIDVSGEK